ncbi:peroxiredoxin-2 isoform X1 [Galendromus occidentalis]|uniref:thioredoxin-dependent peroxiredoxin n=1 Tax=Galendromus occidentalis TaxID=34638 RepID=A0AAJ7PAR5_9ACAR|nr:peroxiredoxin-2 isoform X1 [Galendromus occidentalis]
MAPKLAQPAPDFQGTAVVDGEFKTIKLSDYKGKYVILFFYPLDFTFVCPTEIIAFSEAAQKFRDINCELIACSTDSHFSHLAWINTPRKEGGLGGMNIPLLADKSMDIARAYDVLEEKEGITFRGLYIIDGKGILRQITVNDLPVGRSVDETLRLVQAFQFVDKHGEGKNLNDNCGEEAQREQPESKKRPLSPESVEHFAPDAKTPRVRVPHDLLLSCMHLPHISSFFLPSSLPSLAFC